MFCGGKTSTHLVTRGVRSEVFSVRIKETCGRKRTGFFPSQKRDDWVVFLTQSVSGRTKCQMNLKGEVCCVRVKGTHMRETVGFTYIGDFT